MWDKGSGNGTTTTLGVQPPGLAWNGTLADLRASEPYQ